jgi:hypothetical protein
MDIKMDYGHVCARANVSFHICVCSFLQMHVLIQVHVHIQVWKLPCLFQKTTFRTKNRPSTEADTDTETYTDTDPDTNMDMDMDMGVDINMAKSNGQFIQIKALKVLN